ncbi:WecB/TagA/CpsF family glycosyltransferase [Paraburkholderia sp. Ac-20347]|uniref:WecB/TagA/CpsF family glycosyltransferase n=1 Tax=Paraburkholderia sp. Ac-20347 TaxID=2703892 RepID=UPI002402A74F|nr:WecB/TagA/CpsF family glycosyltransferase [Paraburkholderia sp. Ac-20347]
MNETVSFIVKRVQKGIFTQHIVVNAAKIVHSRKDLSLAASIRASDLINIDGMAVVWAARLLGYPVPERVAGVDLFEKLIGESERRKFKIFLLGATDSVVSKVVDVCRQKFPELEIGGWHNGYFWNEEEALVKKIRESQSQLLFVAITSPHKERFINKWADELGVSFVMGVGGTFDVVAGKVRRAPMWMQRFGLEWLYRVIQEPKRMFKRYAVTNSIFIFLIGRAWIYKYFNDF